MIMMTLVKFADGDSVAATWLGQDHPAQVLTTAVAEAEEMKGMNHAGAWLEFRTEKEK